MAVGCAHHVTQRGVDRQAVFSSERDRRFYLDLLWEHASTEGLEVIGYCLMTNHVHLVVVPLREQSMARALARVQGEYAQRANWGLGRSGHLWQNRYYSCPMDQKHLWRALRYVEMNPVRARLVEQAWEWVWSSAGVHVGTLPAVQSPLAMAWWREQFDEQEWREYLAAGADTDEAELRRSTRNGWALGEEGFLAELERRLGRPVRPRARGKPPKKSPASEASLYSVTRAG